MHAFLNVRVQKDSCASLPKKGLHSGAGLVKLFPSRCPAAFLQVGKVWLGLQNISPFRAILKPPPQVFWFFAERTDLHLHQR